MTQDNFIKMGPDYIAWTSSTTKDEITLLEVLGDKGIRKVSNYKVIVKDLFDVLLFRCHGLRKIVQPDIADLTPHEVKKYLAEYEPTAKLENYTVKLNGPQYIVTFPISELKKLLRINRRYSTWDEVKVSYQSTLDIDTMMEVMKKVITISIVKMSTRSGALGKKRAIGALVTKAYFNEDDTICMYLDSEVADALTPDNNYNAKYLADSFILASEYCKNLHSYVSYFADVFKSGYWFKGRDYTYSSIETVAEAMGVRFNPKIRDYDKKTNEYSRTSVVQFVKKYVKEINEKTRMSELYGILDFEIIRDEKNRGKVKGFKFFFREA